MPEIVLNGPSVRSHKEKFLVIADSNVQFQNGCNHFPKRILAGPNRDIVASPLGHALKEMDVEKRQLSSSRDRRRCHWRGLRLFPESFRVASHRC